MITRVGTKLDDDDVDCSEFICYAVETQFRDPEIKAINNMVVTDEYIEALKEGVLKTAEAALRQKARIPVLELSTCPFGCRCFISKSEKTKNKAWSPWQGGRTITAPFTFPGAKESHTATGDVEYRTRTLSGVCKRSEIMLPA